MEPARSVGKAFSPLDEELGLVGSGLTPRAEETLVRLASWMPFEQAQEVLKDLVGVQVSKAKPDGRRLEPERRRWRCWRRRRSVLSRSCLKRQPERQSKP